MDNKQLLAELRDALQAVRDGNQTSIQVEALSQYLDKWERAANSMAKETDAEHARRLELWKTQLAVSSAEWLEMFKAVSEAGMTALKSSIVINGGAAATLLALLADGLKANGTGHWGPMLSPLGWAWISFMCGLGLAGAATGTRYLSQALYAGALRQGQDAKSRLYKGGDWVRNISVLFGCGSFVLFFVGAWMIFSVIHP